MQLQKNFCYILVILLISSCDSNINTTAINTTAPAIDTDPAPKSAATASAIAPSIAPYTSNPYYWEYNGQPVMLLGGSKDDNLFQIDNLENHLDEMTQVGANYVRNTMSGRDKGNVQAFKTVENGKYNLDQWNEEYWNRFENLLKWTHEREIFVQIELWDQWDHIAELWDDNPWNPDQNVNYTKSNTQLKGDGYYTDVDHTNNKKHDLFLTVPGVNNDQVVLNYQKKFIDKVLSYAFQYDHVLYTVDNELFNQHPIEWSVFWMDYVKEKAREAGKTIQITEMFQETDIKSYKNKLSLVDPAIFDFLEASQNATRDNQQNWNNLQWIREQISVSPRPINHTKIYGGDEVSWTGGDEHGIERFWRNLIGGAASIRFHRPGWGIGLSPKAQTQIRSARMLLSEFNIFNATPDANSAKLENRNEDEAYLSFISGEQYAVYFKNGGVVELDLSDANGSFEVKWLDINESSWGTSQTVESGKKLELDTPGNSSWVALVTKK